MPKYVPDDVLEVSNLLAVMVLIVWLSFWQYLVSDGIVHLWIIRLV